MAALTSLLLIGAGVGLAAGVGAAIENENKARELQGLGKMTPEEEKAFAQAQQAAQGVQQASQGMQNLQGIQYGGTNQALLNQGVGASQNLSSLLQQYSQNPLASQQDIAASQQFAQQAMAPEAVQLQQAFQDQLSQARQQAALSGRNVNDPILRAKLAQEQTRQQTQLQARQTAMAAQIAQTLPGQRVSYAGQNLQQLLSTAGAQQQFNLGEFGGRQQAFGTQLQAAQAKVQGAQAAAQAQGSIADMYRQQRLDRLGLQGAINEARGSHFQTIMGGIGGGLGAAGQIAGMPGMGGGGLQNFNTGGAGVPATGQLSGMNYNTGSGNIFGVSNFSGGFQHG